MSLKQTKVLTVLIFVSSLVALASCSGSEFAGSSSGSAKRAGNGNGPDGGGGADGLDKLGDSDKNGSTNGSGGANGGGFDSGGDSGNNLGNDDDTLSCSNGCCPSTRIALVDCTGTSPKVNKGGFNIDVVSCDQASSATLANYDTIFYHGPSVQGKLPEAIDAKLNAGAKVVAVVTMPAKIQNFYGLALDKPLVGFDKFVNLTVEVTSDNTMSNSFNKDYYANTTIAAGICPPELILLGQTCKYENWCSDLLAKQGSARQSPFHAFLIDDSSRKGFLSFITIMFPSSEFDFTDSFLAGNLRQKWSKTGGTKECGLSCLTGGSDTSNGGKKKGISESVGIGKPVIYLYPTKEQDISVKLAFDGKLETTYPAYDTAFKGWNVRAKPDGQLVDKRDNHEYGFIYWNGTSDKFKHSMDEGFVVSGADTRKFLQEKLAYMGMTPREYNDMIVYWLPYMENHKYNLISFAHKNYTDIAKLDITPKPDSMLRVFMVYKELASPIEVKPQKLERFERKGFSVIEWGGTEIGGDWSVIH